MRKHTIAIAVLVGLAALLPPSGTAAAHGEQLEVVAGGLDNPRGLDIGRWGAVYVAEAGRGGSGPCTAGPEGGSVCLGPTGAVTKIWHGQQRRVLSGLPSLASPADGSGAAGPQDISLRRFGGADLVVGLGADPAARDELGELGAGLGRLYQVSVFGRIGALADLAGYEATHNPDGTEPYSNPNSVLSRAPHKRIVVDAGGNDLLSVRHSGSISTLAVFPERLVAAPPVPPGLPPELPMEAVPTSAATGPDRAVYVSELTGFPFPKGAARIYRVVPGLVPEIYAEGFTNVTDLTFGPDGSLYVLEFAANGMLSGAGALIKVAPDGTRQTLVSEGLIAPTSVAVSPRGDIYISNRGALAGVGEVVRFNADH
jgi:hypothetical protein